MPLGKEVGLGPGHIVLYGDPVGTQPSTAAPPHFRPMSIVAKQSPTSATAELLLRNDTISETFYLLDWIVKLSPILLLYLWWVSPSVNKRNKQVKHGSEFTWLCAAEVNRFNNIFTSFYACQRYTTSQMTSPVHQ